MKKHSRSDTAIEAKIAQLETKLKQMGGIIGLRRNLPREMHLAFLKRVYAYEIREGQQEKMMLNEDRKGRLTHNLTYN